MNNTRKTIILSSILVVLCLFLVFAFYKTYQYQVMLRSMISQANGGTMPTIADTPKVIEKVIGKTNAWRSVQELVKDTVVQIIAHVSELDLTKPYQPPRQYTGFGSGFFINDEGDIITNFHVVNQAKSIWIKIPSLGQRIIDVDIVGVSPGHDIALLKVSEEGIRAIKEEIGKIPYLVLGNSDQVRRSDEVMALGYPLAQHSLKSTTGVISGREGNMIQMSAAINPGSSGGPLLNTNGEVVGINSSGVVAAQNVGYIIPINDLRVVLPDLYKIKVLRKPLLGVFFNNATDSLTEYLGNPKPGGCYVVEIIKNSTLYKAGIKRGDMIYEINGHRIDVYGDMSVVWNEDKISVIDYVSRLSVGQDVHIVAYRNGEKKEMTIKFSQAELPAIHKVYPGFQEIDYEIFGGMVVMQLTLNHIQALAKTAPGLVRFLELKKQSEPALVVTHIFPNSQLDRTRVLPVGSTLNEINGIEVRTLQEFRNAISKVKGNSLTILASDQVTRASDNIFVVLPFDKIIQEEALLSQEHRYPITENTRYLLTTHVQKNKAAAA